jgi:hypothetical protein
MYAKSPVCHLMHDAALCAVVMGLVGERQHCCCSSNALQAHRDYSSNDAVCTAAAAC